MGDPACKQPERLKPLRLSELLFEVQPVRYVKEHTYNGRPSPVYQPHPVDLDMDHPAVCPYRPERVVKGFSLTFKPQVKVLLNHGPILRISEVPGTFLVHYFYRAVSEDIAEPGVYIPEKAVLDYVYTNEGVLNKGAELYLGLRQFLVLLFEIDIPPLKLQHRI
ncbi:hypothetical protein BMS3Bbin06_00978 [bacterium BMS3Bbin06]|nr:hypothetical protein BMS3Bbin06_00978 [bacterium BMS3Bbin06]